MFTIKTKGDWKKTELFLKRAQKIRAESILQRYGAMGVDALAQATPKDSALTASSWDFKVSVTSKGYILEWFNTNENRGANIAILIQYGHGTGTGGYVPPRDFVNPAMKPIFDKLAEDLWKEVSNL